MFVCLLLAVLLLFHTNSFSFSFLPNSILILIFTNKSQDSCLFKMPPAFFHSMAWSCSCECCSSQQLRMQPQAWLQWEVTSEHSDLSRTSDQNEKVPQPLKQGHWKESISLCTDLQQSWRRDHAEGKTEGEFFSVCFSVGESWKRSWHVTNAGG